MNLGPPVSDIAVLVDYPDYGKINIPVIAAKLAKLGIAEGSYFITSVLDVPPPKGDDGMPDIDAYISERKTPPGPDWKRVEGTWISPELVDGYGRALDMLNAVAPKLVIALGKASLQCLTGQTNLESWRGSRMSLPGSPWTVLPTFHPRRLSRDSSSEFIIDMDLARAYNIYTHQQLPRQYDFTTKPTLQTVCGRLFELLARANAGPISLSGDLETRAGHIACFGIADSNTRAICIPHLVVDPVNPFYWDSEDEAIIISLYGQLFSHANITWIGQNFSYDCQYFLRHWGMLPLNVRDTMIGHHALYSNIKKGLDFLSSMWAQDHVYWKDEIKDWDPKIGELQYWEYNCKDACITFEIWPKIESDRSESRVHSEFQQSLFHPVLRIMQRGIRIDTTLRKEMREKLLKEQFNRQEQLNWICDHDINPRSSKKLLELFYKDLGIPGIAALGRETLTTNSPTLALIAERYPMLKPLCQLIVELRSIGVFLSTFIDAELDYDGRLRTEFAIAGPITYRFASRTSAFGSGTNLQNIPIKEKQKIKDDNYVKLPNIRELFIPDDGKTYFDLDLDRADMQVVGRESGDKNLISALAVGIDLHCMSAAEIFGIRNIPVDELVETHPNYKEHRDRIGYEYRDRTKKGGHACDYGIGDRKLAQTLGISVHEAGLFRKKWFGMYPGIRNWHLRTEELVTKQGFLENKFGARLYCFGRFDLPEFLGWLPQSTVAGVINRILVAIDKDYQAGQNQIELQIQVHDSLAGQFPTYNHLPAIHQLKQYGRVIIPYDDPLIIPIGIKTSTVSWGACK